MLGIGMLSDNGNIADNDDVEALRMMQSSADFMTGGNEGQCSLCLCVCLFVCLNFVYGFLFLLIFLLND